MSHKIVAVVIPIITAVLTVVMGFLQLGDKPPHFQFIIVAVLAWLTVLLTTALLLPMPTTEPPTISIPDGERTSRSRRVPRLLVLYAVGLACVSALSTWFLVMTLCYHHVRVSREARQGDRLMTLTAPHGPVHLRLQLSVPPEARIERFRIEPVAGASPPIAGSQDQKPNEVTVILTDFHAPQTLPLTYRISGPALDVALLPTAKPAGIRVFERSEVRRFKCWFWLQGGALWLVGLFVLFARWRWARG